MNKQASIARKRWRGIIQRQVERGVSVAVFCREEGVPQASFYHWRRKLRKESGFAEVRVAPAGTIESVAPECVAPGRLASPKPSIKSSAESLELVLSDNRRIIVRPGFDHDTLLALIDTVDQAATARPRCGLPA